MMQSSLSSPTGPDTDSSTKTGSSPVAAPRAPSPAAARPAAATPAGRLVARTGREAVVAAEELLCGSGAVASRSVAEGLALAGRRTACLPVPGTSPSLGAPVTAAPWVLHRIRGGGGGALPSGFAFELAAATAQEAVDHCLVAHRLTRQVGLPGVCTVDDAVADALDLVRLPTPDALTEVDAGSVATDSDVTDDAAVLAAALDALETVAAATGRPCGALAAEDVGGAEVVLVTGGGSVAEARAVAAALDATCGVVNVALLRPFPGVELGELLGGRRVVVIDPAGGSDGALVTEVRRAVGASGHDPGGVSAVAGSGDELIAGVAALLGVAVTEKPSDTGVVTADSGRLVVGAVPDGPWCREVLLDTAALLAGRDGGTAAWIDCPEPGFAQATSLVFGHGRPDRSPPRHLDLLVVIHPSLLDVAGPARWVGRGGRLLLAAQAESAEELWRSLSEEQRRFLDEQEIELRWIDAGALGAAVESAAATPAGVASDFDPDAGRLALAGALVAAIGEAGGPFDGAIDRVVAAGDGGDSLARLLRDGAHALRSVSRREVSVEAGREEADFRPPRRLPYLALPEQSEIDRSEALYHFHLTGRGALSAAEPFPALPLHPVAATPLLRSDRLWREYPVILPATQDGPRLAVGLMDLLEGVLDEMAEKGEQAPIVREHLKRLNEAARWAVDGRHDPAPLRQVLDEACATFARQIDLSEAAAAALGEELAALRGRLPAGGEVLGLGEHSLLRLYASAVHHERGSRLRSFLAEIDQLVERLRELLRVDEEHAPEAAAPETLTASLGGGGSFIDPAALSRNLPRHRGGLRLGAGRRSRIEKTLATLRTYRESAPRSPEWVLIHPGVVPVSLDLPARVVEHPDSLGVAVGIFDGLVEPLVEVLRAVRVARLEVASAYHPELHDLVLERFDWQAFAADEILLAPPVLVCETGERLQGAGLSRFSELLRSGRPIQVLILDSTARRDLDAPTAAGRLERASGVTLSGYDPGLGYLAVAHREAYVAQSSLALPSHLLRCLQGMAGALRPAVTVAAVPAWRATVSPWLQLAAGLEGRATPCFLYDPEAGTTWAERFGLDGNPQPERPWPLHELGYIDDSTAEKTLEDAFTFAHFAALDPAFRGHFRVVPPAAFHDDQVGIVEYLEAVGDEPSKRLPYLWVVNDRGELCRAVMTREMAFACRDHARAWRILQELAGTGNEYARRAAAAARDAALGEAEEDRRRLEESHSQALEELRRSAAGEAMERLVRVLMDVGTAPERLLAAPVPAASPPAASASAASASAAAPSAASPAPALEKGAPAATAEPAAAAPATVEEDEDVVEEAYVDSDLCTTCNECTNLNPQMFKYNENKQAYLADVTAGPFEQLVKAATQCPSRCIHPGSPRPGDATATPELVAKAAEFN